MQNFQEASRTTLAFLHQRLGLQSAAREIDLVARLGSDEFGILAIECDRPAPKPCWNVPAQRCWKPA